MPKILINETDYTSAGTPGDYSNFAVLITGYMGRTAVPEYAEEGTKNNNPDKIQPDANGAYEFSSKADFINTVGRLTTTEKEVSVKVDGVTTTYKENHYGNQMAYELLNLGYPIIYVPIKSISDMKDPEFWAPFKDRASYDFRFISHGLLETNHVQATYDAVYNDSLKLKAIEAVAKGVADAYKEDEDYKALTTDEDKTAAYKTKFSEACEAEFARVLSTAADGDSYDGFKKDKNEVYTSYAAAKEAIEAVLAEQDNACVTTSVFNTINGNIAELASYRTDDSGIVPAGRGDCVALIELDERTYRAASKPVPAIQEGISNMASNIGLDGKYCAMTVPSVWCKTGGDTSVKFPGAFYYLACFMNSVGSGFAEWYAAAGYTRGVSSYPIDHATVKLGEIAINTLEPRDTETGLSFACNVIANFRGSYYLWGNRTAAPLTAKGLTADHFLNIRQLCTTIKKQLYVSCRRITFDPNSDTLWFNFVNSITPTLDKMKADQGIRDYRIIQVPTDVKAEMKAKIRIIPIEAVEDFDLEVSLEDSFGETTAVVNE